MVHAADGGGLQATTPSSTSAAGWVQVANADGFSSYDTSYDGWESSPDNGAAVAFEIGIAALNGLLAYMSTREPSPAEHGDYRYDRPHPSRHRYDDVTRFGATAALGVSLVTMPVAIGGPPSLGAVRTLARLAAVAGVGVAAALVGSAELNR